MPRMKHAEHGFTTIGQHDVAEFEKLGWKIYTQAEHDAAIAAKRKQGTIEPNGQEPAPTAPAASDPAPARRGRPPKA